MDKRFVNKRHTYTWQLMYGYSKSFESKLLIDMSDRTESKTCSQNRSPVEIMALSTLGVLRMLAVLLVKQLIRLI